MALYKLYYLPTYLDRKSDALTITPPSHPWCVVVDVFCCRRNCLRWKNVTFGTLTPGRCRPALRLCHRLCRCRYVIRHLVASMQKYIAHQPVSLSGCPCTSTPSRGPTCHQSSRLWHSDIRLVLVAYTDIVLCKLLSAGGYRQPTGPAVYSYQGLVGVDAVLGSITKLC